MLTKTLYNLHIYPKNIKYYIELLINEIIQHPERQ